MYPEDSKWTKDNVEPKFWALLEAYSVLSSTMSSELCLMSKVLNKLGERPLLAAHCEKLTGKGDDIRGVSAMLFDPRTLGCRCGNLPASRLHNGRTDDGVPLMVMRTAKYCIV